MAGPMSDENSVDSGGPASTDSTTNFDPSDRADDEQTLADVDQTTADGDQTLSDADQTAADSDQTSAEEDQLAADRDQVASDRDLASGLDQFAHDESQGIRERTTRQRDRAAGRREKTALARIEAADLRDKIAVDRDRVARARDLAADVRNVAMAQLDAASQHDDDARPLTGADIIMRAARQRKRAAQRRTKAAEQRELAAQDRRLAADDREQAARERMHASTDREAFVVELENERERREQALRYQLRAEELARALRQSLSPPRLPPIAGLDVAVHYEASAPEEVGGDFYDLFPLAAGRTGFFLGDVCGKGPKAAAVTSLARYTMRTAAILHETPDAILTDLNVALLMEDEESAHTCTVVYGQIDVDAGEFAITLAVAGHHPPLVVRSDGTVETTSAHGTMLGVIDDPRFEMCEVDLGLGDALVICSDGILDTKINGVRVDEQRVAELLSEASHVSAQALVDRLTHALRANDRPLRDDVAILVLSRASRAP